MNNSYIPIDPATLQSVSGENLMITAYAVILGLLIVYAVYLFVQTGRTSDKIEQLSKHLKADSNDTK